MLAVQKTTTVRVRGYMRDPETGQLVQLSGGVCTVTKPNGSQIQPAVAIVNDGTVAATNFDADAAGEWRVHLQLTSQTGEKWAGQDTVQVA